MISSDFIPEFAILGHPNEGKSSVVSTLAEDDSVRIGPVPGETIKCQTFAVKIDGEEIIKFTDTPGFQCPKQTLAWMINYSGPDELMLSSFIDYHRDDPEFRDECELFGPVAKGAGIIYVVDGSRPLRNDDRAEMEILRLTARPRMAIINWAHARRDYSLDIEFELKKKLKKGTTAFRDGKAKKICNDFFSISNAKNKGKYKDKKSNINLIMTDLVKKEFLKLIRQ